MLEISHLYKDYGASCMVLKNTNLKIAKKDFVFLTGKSGAGKTTLFRLITGYENPTSGRVQINGYEIHQISKRKLPYFRRTIGVVYQDFRLLGDRTVFENIALPLEVMGKGKLFIEEQVSQMMEKVGLTKLRRKYPGSLSGGEKQRVAIARALIHRPPIVIADEPTGNLDKKLASEILEIFKEAHSYGTTVVVATHDLDLIPRVSNSRWINIEKMKLVEKNKNKASNELSIEESNGELNKWSPSSKTFKGIGLDIL